MRFTKMQGLGNDYIYLDAVREPAIAERDDLPDLARVMADRHTGVGGDGIILIATPEPGVDADLRMRMFNADGSESQMCGNGIRCVCKYARDRGLTRARPVRVQTGRGVLALDYELDDDGLVERVTVNMGAPILDAHAVPVRAGELKDVINRPVAALFEWPDHFPRGWERACGLEGDVTCVSTGNPHAVLFVADVHAVPLDVLGPWIERHHAFPERTNVHVAQATSPETIVMRTWERGSGITRACGTGATAVAVAGVLTGRTGRSVRVRLPGGELDLRWDEATNDVFMTGPAVEVFTGEWPDETPTARAVAPAHARETEAEGAGG